MIGQWLQAEYHVSIERTVKQKTGGMATQQVNLPGVRVTVERMEWRAVGGPWRARVRLDGELGRLWGVAELLRCGLKIYDGRGLAWWGYVSAVELHEGARAARVSLDEMANRVAVAFRPPAAYPGGGERVLTDWVEDADSIRAYGVKERIFEAGEMHPSQAAGRAAALLAKVGQPQSACRIEADGGNYAVVEARGWWETLGWKYYQDTRGAVGNYNTGAGLGFGQSAGYAKMAQSFAAGPESWQADEVWVRMRKEGLPADGPQLELCADGAGGPGTALVAAPLPGAWVTNEWDWIRFALPKLTLTAGAKYWVQLSRTGALNATHYYLFSADMKLSYAEGELRRWDGTAWVAYPQDADLCFMVRGTVARGALLPQVVLVGPFFAGVRMEAAVSSEVASPYYPLPVDARELAEGLLLGGGVNNGRLLATVDAGRLVRVRAQPSSTRVGAVVDTAGQLRGPTGRVLAASEQPAGQWVQVGATQGGPKLANLGAVFANRVTWTAADGLRVYAE